jgi:preprotein translocase subunit YajC
MMVLSLLTLSLIFLFAPPSGNPNETPNPLIQVVPLILVVLVFYFFMIRPQQKKEKERQKALDALKKGDKVVTIGGMHGTIVEVNQEKKTVIIQAAENIRLKFDRSAIATVEKSETTDKSESKK